MQKIILSQDEIKALQQTHRWTKNGKKRDRIKAILCLNEGFTLAETARILLLDEDTVATIRDRFLEDGMDTFLEDNYVCYCGRLTAEQKEKVRVFVKNNIIMDAIRVVEFIANKFNIKYTRQGVIDLLHGLNFTYKKTKHVPAKANIIAQALHLYNRSITIALRKDDEVYCFVDGVHPLHNSMTGYGWIEKGTEKFIKSNPGRNRVNINGAYCVQTQEVVVVASESINTQSTIELYKKLEEKYIDMRIIYVFRDNARYYHNEMVRDYLKTSRIVEIPLPTYAPNLNAIEALWRFMKREILYCKYYEHFADFQQAIHRFFHEDFSTYQDRLRSFIAGNFRVLGT